MGSLGISKYASPQARYEAQMAQQRHWRDARRAAGLCPTCGGTRDRAPLVNCQRCHDRIQHAKEKRSPVLVPWTAPVPAVSVVHPRWPSPLKGSIAQALARVPLR